MLYFSLKTIFCNLFTIFITATSFKNTDIQNYDSKLTIYLITKLPDSLEESKVEVVARKLGLTIARSSIANEGLQVAAKLKVEAIIAN